VCFNFSQFQFVNSGAIVDTCTHIFTHTPLHRVLRCILCWLRCTTNWVYVCVLCVCVWGGGRGIKLTAFLSYDAPSLDRSLWKTQAAQ
jgi:hypothetical protein